MPRLAADFTAPFEMPSVCGDLALGQPGPVAQDQHLALVSGQGAHRGERRAVLISHQHGVVGGATVCGSATLRCLRATWRRRRTERDRLTTEARR